jgi:hypothetical protein
VRFIWAALRDLAPETCGVMTDARAHSSRNVSASIEPYHKLQAKYVFPSRSFGEVLMLSISGQEHASLQCCCRATVSQRF